MKVSKADIELHFQKLLEQIRPTEELIADLPAVAAKVWAAKQGDSQRELKRLFRLLEDKKQQRHQLVMMRARQELSGEEFEEAKVTCLA